MSQQPRQIVVHRGFESPRQELASIVVNSAAQHVIQSESIASHLPKARTHSSTIVQMRDHKMAAELPPGSGQFGHEMANFMPSHNHVELPFSIQRRERGKGPINISSWILLRGSQAATALAPAGELGGSQIGMRAIAAIIPLSRADDATVSAKLTSAIAPARQAEMALGIGLRHKGSVSAEISLEHRFKIDRAGRNAISIIASAGASDFRISDHISASGYAQAGIVGLKSKDLFADMAISAEHDLTKIRGNQFSGGLGVWAAVQPGIRRVDIGPRLSAKIPVNSGGMRVSVDYRFRIGGNANPQSGPSVSIAHFF